jgi:hypothetical protein
MNIAYDSLVRIIQDEIEKYLSEIDSEDVKRFAHQIKKELSAKKSVKKELSGATGKRDDSKACFTAAEWMKFQNNMNKSEDGKLYQQAKK